MLDGRSNVTEVSVMFKASSYSKNVFKLIKKLSISNIWIKNITYILKYCKYLCLLPEIGNTVSHLPDKLMWMAEGGVFSKERKTAKGHMR